MQKTNDSTTMKMHLKRAKVKVTDRKDGLTLEVLLTFCLIAFIVFIFFAITFRLYNH